jgi:hypothetical protein
MRKSAGTDSGNALQSQFKWSSQSIVTYWASTSSGYALLRDSTPHFLFTELFMTLSPYWLPTTPTPSVITNSQIDRIPRAVQNFSTVHQSKGKWVGVVLNWLPFLPFARVDGKGGRKEIIYFLVLPKAISILRVSSLHPHPKLNTSLTDSGPHPNTAPWGLKWLCLHCMEVPLHCRTFSFRILQILWEFSGKLIFSYTPPSPLAKNQDFSSSSDLKGTFFSALETWLNNRHTCTHQPQTLLFPRSFFSNEAWNGKLLCRETSSKRKHRQCTSPVSFVETWEVCFWNKGKLSVCIKWKPFQGEV